MHGGGKDMPAACWRGGRREKLHLEGPGVDGEIILKWILWSSSAGLIWLTEGSCSWPFEHSNETGSVKVKVKVKVLWFQ
jgi:hypothetical protein